MPGKVTFIDYQEPTFVTVAKFLKSTENNRPVLPTQFYIWYDSKSPSTANDYSKDAGRIYIHLADTETNPYVGIIDIDMTNGEPWKFDVFGAKHLEVLTRLARCIAEDFDTEISLQLAYEEILSYLPKRYSTDDQLKIELKKYLDIGDK